MITFHTHQRGAALVFALMVSLLLGTLAAFFAHQARSELKQSTDIADAIIARQEAKNGLNKTIYGLSNLGHLRVDWPNTQQSYESIFWGKTFSPEPSLTLKIKDVGSMLNLVPFKPKEWQAVLQYHGVDELMAHSITDRILDWMDDDDLRRIRGMEKRQYQYSNLEILPRNNIMQSLEEIKFVPDITKEVYQLIKSEALYWGVSSRNPLNGSAAMISAYGDDALYEGVLRRRQSNDSVGTLYNQLENIDPTTVNRVQSNMFLITIKSVQASASFHLSVIVNFSGNTTIPFYLTEWQ